MPTLRDPLRTARHAVRAGRFRDAAEALDQVATEVRESAEGRLLAAMAAWRLGRFGPSRDHAVAAREAYRTAGDVDGQMRAENVAAAGAFALGDLDAAETGFGRALLLARRLADDLMAARCANNLGNVAFYLARHEEARSFYRLANAAFERLGFLHGLAETWINLGLVDRDVGDMAAALAAADHALDAAEAAGQPRLRAQALVSRGEAVAALGDTQLARVQIARGLGMAREEADRLAETEALRVLGGVERRAEQWEDAERLLREALAVARRLDHPWAMGEVHRDLGVLHAAAGRPAEAAQAFDAASTCFLRLGSIPRAEDLRRRAAFQRDRR